MKKLLFLTASYNIYPTEKQFSERYKYLSKHYTGYFLGIVPSKDFQNYKMHNFALEGLYLPKTVRYNVLLRTILRFIFFTAKAIKLFVFKGKYDAVVALDPLSAGIIGIIVSKITGTKLIIEVGGNFESSFRFSSQKPTLLMKLKGSISRKIIPYILNRADAVKLVYENQLRVFNGSLTRPEKYFCVPNLVPLDLYKPNGRDLKYILFLGFPWYLKGVDILIRAFNAISADFPDYRLKIVGHCPDKSFFKDIVNGNNKIELLDAVWHEEAVTLMEGCSIFVQPSRTDSLPRVLREAMAAKKTIIASDVDGIPTIVKHGYNGLIFKSEDVDDLADKMKLLLRDRNYAEKLAENGYAYVHSNLSEEKFIEKFNKMVEVALNS